LHVANRIVKSIDLKAPPERLWRALTNHEEFGNWFKVRLDGPFVPREVTTGRITYPGSEHYRWLSRTVQMDEGAGLFAFTWVQPDDPTRPGPHEPSTLVEFRLEATANGTRVTVTESGFDSLPADRRSEVVRGNEQGWEIQSVNLKTYVEA
jgi:uncharacterized protein YndB with AHSA1/START domain